MTTQTLALLQQLKLTGMADVLKIQQEQPHQYQDLPFNERLSMLIDSEQLQRDNRRQQRLLKAAKLKLHATARDVDYQHPRGLNQSVMLSLLQCEWLQKSQSLLVTGPCGCGKTWLTCALGHTACLKGYSVRYFRISRLMLQLSQAKADGSYSRLLQQLARTDLLILDDWGLEPLSAPQRNDLMEIMDDRHGCSSTAIISQLPTDQWYQSIGDNTLADAILDRLMHNSHRLKLKGESLRKVHSELTNGIA